MDDRSIKRALGGIRMKDDMKKRIMEACLCEQKSKRIARTAQSVLWTALACLLITIAAVGIPYLGKKPNGENVVEFSGTITAMAMGSDGSDVETMMTVDKSIIMVFCPYASSLLPGLPFKFNFADCEMEVAVNSGHLFEHTDESKIVEHGESYRFVSEKTIAWSPLSSDTWDENDIAQRSDMTFDVYKNGERVGSGLITIQLLSEDDSFFNEHPELAERQEKKWDYFYRVTLCAYTGSGQIGRNAQYGGATVGDESMLLVEPIDEKDIQSAELLEMPDENIIQTFSQSEVQEFATAYNEAMLESNDIGTTHPLAVRITFSDGTTITVLGGTQGFSTVERNGAWFNVNGAALSSWFEKRLPQ